MTNKEIASSFLKMVVDKKVKEAYEKFISPKCIHHNQHFKGDAKSLMIAMEENNKKNPNKSLAIKRVYEDGDTVITLSHVKLNPEDLGVALVHIFRFENEKVIELWDQGQLLIKDSPNENGVF